MSPHRALARHTLLLLSTATDLLEMDNNVGTMSRATAKKRPESKQYLEEDPFFAGSLSQALS